MKNDSRKYKIAAVSVVLLMAFSSFTLVQVASDDSDAASDSWTCTITINGTSITTKYAKNGSPLSHTTPVSGNDGNASVGSWGFDSKTGYGPFGSFYAAVDVSTGKIAYHLDPSDLSKALDGTHISGTGYNIMWVLPTVWMKVTDVTGRGNSTLTMSNERFSGADAPAHTIDGKVYNYLALGVYEAYDDGSKLYSYSGASPTTWTSLSDFQAHARNTGADGGHSMVWNFYQFQLYRICSLAVMENFNSQAQIGFGNVNGSLTSTGTTMDKGPYYGTVDASTTGEKLFIENVWGNVFDLIGDAYWYYGLYAGQNSVQKSGTKSGLDLTTVTSGLGYYSHAYGTAPYSTNLDSWGLPTTNDSPGASAPDWFFTASYNTALVVGGSFERNYGGGRDAGISYFGSASHGGFDTGGTRLAMVFDDDPMAHYTVEYDLDGGAGSEFTDTVVLRGNEYTIPNAEPEKTGSEFIAWWDGGANLYEPGEKIAVYENITLKAIWDTYVVLIDLDGGSWSYTEFDPDYPFFVLERGTYTIPDEIPTKDGCTFMGWRSEDTTYEPGDQIHVASNAVLTAVWGHEVAFDLDGGRWSLDDTVVAESGTYTVPADVPTKSGCTFDGWKCGNDIVQPGESIELDSDVTLEAAWTTNFVPVPDDDDYYPVVPVTPASTSSNDDDTKTIVACAAAAVAAALAVAFFLVDSRRP